MISSVRLGLLAMLCASLSVATACGGEDGADDPAGAGGSGGGGSGGGASVSCSARTNGCTCADGDDPSWTLETCSADSVADTAGAVGFCCDGFFCDCSAVSCAWDSGLNFCTCGSVSVTEVLGGTTVSDCSGAVAASPATVKCCLSATGTCTCRDQDCGASEEVPLCSTATVTVCEAGKSRVAACK